MKRASLLIAVVLLLPVLQALGHAGEVHTYMGTISRLDPSGAFTLKKTDGTDFEVAVSPKTAYLDAKGKPAKPDMLEVGMRVVVKIAKDGKTAMSVKMSATKPKG